MRYLLLLAFAGCSLAQVYRLNTVTDAQAANNAFFRKGPFYLAGFGTYYGGPIQIKAGKAEESGSVLKFTGSVEIKTDTMTLRADEVAFDKSTHEMRPSGSVVLIPFSATDGK